MCRPPPGGESWLGLFIIIFWGCFSEGSQVGCSRAARWDIRGTEELGGRGSWGLLRKPRRKGRGGGANRRGKRACQRRRKSRGRLRGRLSGKNILNLRHPHLLMSGIFSIDLWICLCCLLWALRATGVFLIEWGHLNERLCSLLLFLVDAYFCVHAWLSNALPRIHFF